MLQDSSYKKYSIFKTILAENDILLSNIEILDGDASKRIYYRVKLDINNKNFLKLQEKVKWNPKNTDSNQYILMDYAFDDSKVKEFIDISNYLNRNNFNAPHVLFNDRENKFLILNDLGTDHLKNLFDKAKTNEEKIKLYSNVIDLLINMQQKFPQNINLEFFSHDKLIEELNLFLQHYVRYLNANNPKHEINIPSRDLIEFNGIWQKLFNMQYDFTPCLVHRDFHAENLMCLNGDFINNHKQIALIDFQDSLVGSPMYDLASIIDDIRVDMPRAVADYLLKYYGQKRKLPMQEILYNYHILTVQRNLRILGVFTMHYFESDNDKYLHYIPRVKKYLNKALEYPALSELKLWLMKFRLL